MRKAALALIAAVAAFSAAGGPAAGPQSGGNKTQLKAKGCVRRGVEAGCLLLAADNGATYNIFANPKPEPGLVIQIEGAIHAGPTTCQQGVAVDVAEWKATGEKCGDESR